MSVAIPRYSYREYQKWEGDWELIDGYPFAMSPSPMGKHQKLMMNLGFLLKKELEECECEVYPELDWIIDEKNVVRPDLAVYCEDIETYPKTTPKIVIEIISDSTIQRDEEIKYMIYEVEKVEYYVIAYPDFGKVRIFELKGGKYQKAYEGDGKFGFDVCDIEVDFRGAF